MFVIFSSLVTIISEVIIRGYYHESSDCFEHPQKFPSCIKLPPSLPPPKKILAKFSYQKNAFGSSIAGIKLSFLGRNLINLRRNTCTLTLMTS